MTDDVAGVILAGGSSRRFGRDKARLLFEGESLLARAVRTVGRVVDPVIVVGPEFRQQSVPDVAVITDQWPGAGPLGAVVTGLSSVETDAAFVCACDMPRLRSTAIEYLVSIASSSDADAVIPIVDGRAQVLHSVYRSSATHILRGFIARGRRHEQSLQRAISELSVIWVSELDMRRVDPTLMTFSNINDKSDWDHLVGKHPTE